MERLQSKMPMLCVHLLIIREHVYWNFPALYTHPQVHISFVTLCMFLPEQVLLIAETFQHDPNGIFGTNTSYNRQLYSALNHVMWATASFGVLFWISACQGLRNLPNVSSSMLNDMVWWFSFLYLLYMRDISLCRMWQRYIISQSFDSYLYFQFFFAFSEYHC